MTFPLASSGLLPADSSHEELVRGLRDLLRLRTINPPGDEIVAARHLARRFEAVGLEPTIVEPEAGRGSVITRVRGDGSRGGPLLLMGHLDVVPVEANRWRHDPFGGEIADGRIFGRGVVDMKAMVAMEVQVIVELARATRAAGLAPATDPVPGLGRDVIFAGTADEEAGGALGMSWIVDNEPELLRADAALNEAGGVSFELLGRRWYPIQVAEKGKQVYRITVNGANGHASMPRDDNAAVLAADVISRLATEGEARWVPIVDDAFEAVLASIEPRLAERIRSRADRGSARARAGACSDEPEVARAISSLLHDTVSPDVLRAGYKYNVIPGSATIEIDCRTLPGTSPDELRVELRRRLGEPLWERCELEVLGTGPALEQPRDHEILAIAARTLVRHDPPGVPLQIMAPFGTDAKHTARLGIPTYGFSPLRLEPGEHFLARFHGDDEQLSLSALRFGLPVLREVVLEYCRTDGGVPG
jgi:acetylornithine deacetylase/succinyl-diaminopimelate desuccinylase-like protein